MRITKPKRSRTGAKRLDLTDMREVFRDRRMWSGIGIVVAPDGDDHFEVSDDDVLVEVVLQPSEEPITCRLAAGVWDVPDEGDEVGVILPEGSRDFMPIVVCRLSTRSVPQTQGPQPGRMVLEREEIVAHDGSGGATPLATEAFRDSVGSVLDALDALNAALLAAHGPLGTYPEPGIVTAATALAAAKVAFDAASSTYLTDVFKAK